MAEKEGDLIFPMRLEVDPSQFKSGWDKIEPELQKIIDAKPLKVKLDIDDIATNKIKAAVSKQAKETEEVVENSIKAIQMEMKAMTGASENLDIFGDTKAIDALIQKSRDLKNTINEVKTAALPLKDILSIGGKTPTGLDLKRQKDELQRFISLEKEGSRDAIVANEKLIQVKERLRNMYGKQESALKATDEEKKVNETIVAYKRLSAELDKINARIRIRESIKSGSIIAPSSVSASSMGTKTEAEMYNNISQAMDKYKTSLSAVNQEKLKATPSEASKSEIALGNQNLYIQTKVEEAARRASAEQTKLWSKYGQVLKGPENTIYQIQKKLDIIASTRADLKMNPAQIKEADTAVAALKKKLDGLRMPASATGQLANLSKQWSALSAQEEKGVAGKDIIEKYRLIDKAAGGASGTLRNAALKTDQFSTSLNKNSQALKSQRGIMNGMPQFVNSYISILGAYRLGKNIVDTTAEFEMQRVSLAAIIQNKTKADELFAKSVEMGIESPFMIKDIITYTKQLAAYRIETDQLFDTTKRLADVSAGLGVGMDRLILAYGQVKAASVLRGQELRQFTEAGIPMVELLADKFTILNGKATTTAEVFDMIRARGVSFEMVKEIFEDMTNAGGMFNNMQAIQAQTLKGSLTNLRDAMDKTFMQMGEGAKGPIKNLVDGLRMLMENWKKVSDVGLGVVGVLATVKIATMAYNAAIGEETAAVIANVMAEKKKEAITLQRLAATRALSAAERLQIATTRKLTMADWESMAAKGQLTKLMLFQAVATKRITVMQGEILGMMIGVKRAEIAQITTKSKLIVYTKLLTAALKVQLVALRATMAALLTNPLTWIAAAAFGVYKLISGIFKYNKEYTEMADNMRKQSAQVAGEMTDSYKGMATSIQEAFGKGASEQAMMSARKSMQDILEKNELIKVLLDDRLSKLLTEKERLEEVRDMWNEVHAAAKNDPGYMASAQKETGGLLDDDVVENAEKVADKLNEINSYLAKTDAKGYNVIGVRKEFEELRRQFDEGEISIDRFSSELTSMLLNNKESLDGTVFGKLSGKVKDSQRALRSFESDMERMAKSTIAQIGAIDGVLPVFGVDKFGLSDESLGNIQSRLATQTNFWLQSLGDIDAGQKRLLTTQMKIQAQFPFKNKDQEENPYAKSYNAFLEKRGLGKVAKMGKYDMEKSDATQLESVASALKTAEEELERYNAQVKAGNNLNKIKISGKKEEIRQLKIAWAFLGGTEKSIGSKAKTTDPRIATLSNQLKVLREAYAKYNKLRKDIGNEAARSEVEGLYGGLMTGVKIDKVPELREGLKLAFTEADLSSASKILEKGFGQLGSDATDELRSAVLARTDSSFDEIADNFKRNLDQMGRKIEQTQRANEFFEKMLGLTGSEEAAARLTKAMGMAVGDMRSGYYAALGDILGHNYMQGVDLGDVKSTQDAINKMRVDGYTTAADAAQAQLDGLVDYEQKQLETILATTEEFMTAEQKKAQIARTTAKLLKDIENNPLLTKDEKTDRSAAVSASGISAAIGVDLDEIQKSKEYVAAFDDLSRTGGMALDGIYEKLSAVAAKTGISATDLNTIMGLLQKIREQQEQANPFKAWGEAIEGYKLALANIKANGITKENQTQLVGAAEKLTQAGQNIGSVFTTVISPLQKTVTLAEEVADSLGIAFGDQTKGAIDDFMKGFEIMSSGIEIVNSVLAVNDTLTKIATASKASLATTNVAAAGTEIALAGATTATGVAATGASVGFDVLAASIWAAMAPLWPLLAVAAAVGAAIAIINAKAKKQQKIQENLANKIKDLDDAYQKLQHTEERALGSEYLATVRKEQDILLQQEKAALEQAYAEREKGRKRDREKEKEYLRQAADYRQQALDKEEEIMAKFTGYSGATDAALSFADAWLEAYKSFASTTDAMSEKFSEMVDNMVAKSVLAAIIAAKLESVFALIKSAYDPNGPGGANATKEEWAGIKSAMSGITIGLDSEARSAMESIGLKPGYGQDKPELSGISASVATMDESAANTLGGYLNSGLMQWVKQTGLQNRIALAVEANNVQKPLADIYALQSQSLAAIQSIKADTAVMVGRLTTIMESQNDSMIKGGLKAVNVRLLN